jgi:hypothetical protein
MTIKYWGVGTMMNGIEWTTTNEAEARKGYLNFTKEEMWDKDDEAHLYSAEVEPESLVDEDGYEHSPSFDLFECPESYRPETYSWGKETEVYCTDASVMAINKPFQATKRRLNASWFTGKGTKAVPKLFYEIDGTLYDADNFVEF